MFVGIDPDLTHTGLAVVNGTGTVVGVECCSASARLRGSEAVLAMTRALSGSVANMVAVLGKELEAVVIEGQHVTFRTPNPRNIIHLAQVAGAAAGCVNEQVIAPIKIVEASQWKGQVPKQIHQRHLLEALGWEHECHGTPKRGYAVPTNPPVGRMLTATQWKHVVDAIGLARWAWQRSAFPRARPIG